MQVVELRKRTYNLPDDYLVVLVGDMITEEALPTYMAMLNRLDGVRDETGVDPTPWGRQASFFPNPSGVVSKDSVEDLAEQTAQGLAQLFRGCVTPIVSSLGFALAACARCEASMT